jgi:hypothetical protein
MKQLEERQTNVEDKIAGMEKKMVTMSRVESMAARKFEEVLAKKMAESQVIHT